MLRPMLVCVVCGGEVVEGEGRPGCAVYFRGARRVFCGGACRLAFKRDPERFVPEPAATARLPIAPALRKTPFLVRAIPRSSPQPAPLTAGPDGFDKGG